MSRYGIGEWFGEPFSTLAPERRRELANAARGVSLPPPCPFQRDRPPCRKAGGVCSFQRYTEGDGDRIGGAEGDPVIICPARFEQDELAVRWLAEIVGFSPDETMLAREIPFMQSTSTDKPAGKIDLIIGRTTTGRMDWYGLEIQAVYFSGHGMTSQFEILMNDDHAIPPYPDRVRRPDWRSSSAKRLMPQLQIKAPTVRRWQTKIAVAVDKPFFEAVGGPSTQPSQDINDGDIIWLIPELVANEDGSEYRLERGHWEVLTLEQSTAKLLAARTISRDAFEAALLSKLTAIGR